MPLLLRSCLILKTFCLLAVSAGSGVLPAVGQVAPQNSPSPTEKKNARWEVNLLPIQAIPLPETLGFKDLNQGIMPGPTQSVVLSRKPGSLPSTHLTMYGEPQVMMIFEFFTSPQEAKQAVVEAHKRVGDLKTAITTEILQEEGTEKFAFGIFNLRTIVGRKYNVKVQMEYDRRDMAAEEFGKLYEKMIAYLDSQAALVSKAGEMREWQNQSGKKIQAKLLKYDPEKRTVDLQLEKGQISKNVSTDKFSASDQEFLSVFGIKAPAPVAK